MLWAMSWGGLEPNGLSRGPPHGGDLGLDCVKYHCNIGKYYLTFLLELYNKAGMSRHTLY